MEDGVGAWYTRAEWDADADADWSYDAAGGLLFQGSVPTCDEYSFRALTGSRSHWHGSDIRVTPCELGYEIALVRDGRALATAGALSPLSSVSEVENLREALCKAAGASR